jgi:hypothetical protein
VASQLDLVFDGRGATCVSVYVHRISLSLTQASVRERDKFIDNQ